MRDTLIEYVQREAGWLPEKDNFIRVLADLVNQRVSFKIYKGRFKLLRLLVLGWAGGSQIKFWTQESLATNMAFIN